MKCKSCQGDVPPKFAHAILVNMCPLCGETIMDEELQAVLVGLKEAMAMVSMYPVEIFDWLKSNYNLYTEEEVQVKIKETETKTAATVKASIVGTAAHNAKSLPSPEMAKKIEVDKDGNQIAGPSLQSAEQTNKFFKNALADKTLDQQSHFKNIAKQIKKNGSPALMDENGTAGVITPDMAEAIGQVDESMSAELRAAFGDDGEESINSGLDGDYDYEDEIPAVVMGMAAKASGGQVNMKDVARLQNLQGKSARAKSEIARTGSVGLIRR